jgi:uncharacterized RDD family membrane protein YckC
MFFCASCKEYAGATGKGSKANLSARLLALLLDPIIGFVLGAVPLILFKKTSPALAVGLSSLVYVAYFIWFLILLKRGVTPGKLLLRLQVVDQRSGDVPSFGRMFLRETIGRIISGFFFGLGYLWAIFDRNAQTWHDKLARTVVVRRPQAQPVAVRAAA